jgi:paraquat-inducible protein A
MSAARRLEAADEVAACAVGLTACEACGRTLRLEQPRCPRCGARPHPPTLRSLQAVWAWLIAGIVAYVPANIAPMLITRQFGRSYESTIVGGAIDLFGEGSWFVGGVVLTASVAIPILKFVVVGYLAISIRRGWRRELRQKQRLHALVEAIGRWSMIDVFVVALLAALIQLGFLAEVAPGPAAAPFALSVAFTMIAAQRLDSRLIWLDPARLPA